ncbi:hypothetical protein MXB_961 [Myxobolus squamalis]|nr:hypothetical protein MXB_961 [Myxobolus squamalis]
MLVETVVLNDSIPIEYLVDEIVDSNKKFSISFKSKKVYDISLRKVKLKLIDI